MSKEENKTEFFPPGCGLWLSWVFANLIGMTLGWALGWWISSLVPGIISTATLALTVGLCLGFMQWLTLRGYINSSLWWLASTSVGWLVGFTVGVKLVSSLGWTGVLFGLMVGATTGLILGVLQWLVLRKQVSKAGWWLPISIIGWTSALLYYLPGVTAIGIIYGLLSGMLTGLAILWLVYRPVDSGN